MCIDNLYNNCNDYFRYILHKGAYTIHTLTIREMEYDLGNEEVIDIIKKEAEDMGSHFTRYVVEVEVVENAYDDHGGQYPGYYLLRIIAKGDVEFPPLGNTVPNREVIVDRAPDEQAAGLALYERALELQELLSDDVGADKVSLLFPRWLLLHPDSKSLKTLVPATAKRPLYNLSATCNPDKTVTLYNDR